MTGPSNTEDDLKATVVEKLQFHLATPDLPLTSRLLADLGVESIALVTILLDLADHLQVDLLDAHVNLSELETVQDLISLLDSLMNRA